MAFGFDSTFVAWRPGPGPLLGHLLSWRVRMARSTQIGIQLPSRSHDRWIRLPVWKWYVVSWDQFSFLSHSILTVCDKMLPITIDDDATIFSTFLLFLTNNSSIVVPLIRLLPSNLQEAIPHRKFHALFHVTLDHLFNIVIICLFFFLFFFFPFLKT